MASWSYVSVQRNVYRFPDRCAACLKPGPQTTLRLRSDFGYFKRHYIFGSVHEYLWVHVPFCEACAAHQMRCKRVGQFLLGLGVVGGVAVSIWLDLGRWPTILLGILLAVPGIWMLEFPRLGIKILWFDKDRLAFSFKRPEYAHEFAVLNGQSHVVLPDGRVMYVSKQGMHE